MTTKGIGIDGSADCDHRSASWELIAETRAASRARALTGRTLRAWRVSDPTDLDDIVLMVDELITNAVVHGTGPVRLCLRLEGARLEGPCVIGEVSDGNPAAPAAPQTAPHILDWSEAGRGLLLVCALATEFGVRPDGAGKTVWFTRRLHPLDGPATLTVPPETAPFTASDN